MARLIVVEESLGDRCASIAAYPLRDRFSYALADELPVTIAEFHVPDDDVLRVADQIASSIEQERYFAHFWLNAAELLVVFPRCLVRLRRDDRRSVDLAQTIGRQLGIPDAEMRFPEMFDVDHPDREDT